MKIRNIYIPICIINFIITFSIAVTMVPYFGNEWGDSYFAFIRTCVLGIHYIIHTLFLCLHCKLLSKKSFWLIASLSAHIFIIYKSIPITVFFWLYI